MKQLLMVYGGSRGSMRDEAGQPLNYSSIWAESEKVDETPDRVGQPPMKMNCDPAVIDQIRGKCPAKFEVEVKMIAAGGAKAGLYISSAVLLPLVPAAKVV